MVGDRLVAAAHLVRYGDDARVGDDYRNAGEIRWLVFFPGFEAAADDLAAACGHVLDGWRVTRRYADGALPAPGCYGVPDCWPHVGAALGRVGFMWGQRTEIVGLAEVADLPSGGPPPIAGLSLRREVGGHATRFSAVLDGWVVGFHEVEADLTAGGTRSRLAGWGDVWELHADPGLRRRGVATWLVGHAADWLRLAGRLILYAVNFTWYGFSCPGRWLMVREGMGRCHELR